MSEPRPSIALEMFSTTELVNELVTRHNRIHGAPTAQQVEEATMAVASTYGVLGTDVDLAGDLVSAVAIPLVIIAGQRVS